MKKILTAAAMALLILGCAKEYDDSGLRELISGLDYRVSELESSVSGIQSTIGDGKFVRKVEEYLDPDTGRTTGVTVTYTDGAVVHFNIVPTDPSQGPVVSVIRNGAGDLVWAVDGVSIKMDGKEIPVYQTPTFSIDDDGNLLVEVDGETTNLGPVTSGGATLQDGIFTDLAVTDEAVVLTLSDGSTVNIPFAEAFKLNIETAEFAFSKLEPIEIPYTVSAKTEGTVVGVAGYSPKDFSVEVADEKIVVTPLRKDAAAVMMAYADSKVGLVSVVNLIVEAEGFEITDAPYSAEYDYLAEGEDAVVVANAVSNIAFEVKPVDEWIHVASVKSTAYAITFKLDDNKTGEIRVGTVNVVKAETETVVQTITIAQLPAAAEEGGAANLSKKESANSYLVYAPGEYKFKAVKGNSGTPVGDVAEAVIVWETNNTATAPEAGSIIASVEAKDGYIHFTTPETLTPGNALIAAKDAAGEILWSWHIWIPKTEIQTVDAGFAGEKALMDRNLGALEPAPVSGILEAEGLYFQWGRKDPLLGKKITAVPETVLKQSVDSSPTDIATATKTPTVFYYNEGKDWLATPDANLWDNAGAKTEYDPCPPGYKVPAYDTSLDIWNKVANDVFPTLWTYDEAASYVKFTTGTATFPLCGYLNGGGQSISGYGKRSLVWSSTAKSDTHGSGMFVRENKYYSDGNHKACGGSVRCIVVDESAITPPTPSSGSGSESGPVDLSKDASANSYVIAATSTAGAQYKFKAVKGNSEETVGDVAKVEVIWETWNTAEEPGQGSVVAAADYADGYVTITMPETLHAGNALIAAKDAGDVILWSWHIWVPAVEVTAADYTSFIGGSMMNMNLGAIEPVPATGPATVETFGLLYQWGRKDPFVGAAEYDSYPKKAAVSGTAWVKTEGKVSIEEAIKNPTVLYIDAAHSDDHDWNATSEATLWDNEGKKTIYDPCPVGYKVPVKAGDIWNKTDDGWNFDVENHVSEYTSAAVRIPLAGYVECYGGSLYGSGGGAEHTYLWSATHHDTERGECLYVRTSKDPGSRYYKAYRGKGNAGSVRCIAE